MSEPAAMADLPHVLVVDDDTRLRRLLERYLRDNGFFVTSAEDAADARAKLSGVTYDIVILDVMMPGESGLELTADLSARPGAPPILMLTAMGEPDDRIAGLEGGAEDYLSKPFDPRELLLRLRTILRRRVPPPRRTEIVFGPFTFDPARRELRREGVLVRLTDAEAGLLAALAGRPGEPIERGDLIPPGGSAGGERAVDVQVTRLRRKIEPDARFPRYVQTVRGRGYVLMADGTP